MTKKVLVPIADGCEEIEAVCIIDILRRAGALVTVASVDKSQIIASRGVNLVADKLIADCLDRTYDLIALPGGMPGAEHLRDSEKLTLLLKRQQKEGRFYAAICASPVVVLQHHGLLEQCQATCHPNFVNKLKNSQAVQSRVVINGTCITSRGAGTALEFSLKLVELLFGDQKAKKISQAMLID